MFQVGPGQADAPVIMRKPAGLLAADMLDCIVVVRRISVIQFASEAYDPIAAALKKSTQLVFGRSRSKRFENGESHVEIRTRLPKNTASFIDPVGPNSGHRVVTGTAF